MNVVGIVAEYNPMHNGHIYNINKAKELTKADFVIIIMSGSFTEQGNISVMDKFTKAEIAIQNGADMVIELPTIFATSSAENFAYGAINILDKIGIITHLCFGAESDNIIELQDIAKIKLNNKNEIIQSVKDKSKQGMSLSQAYAQTLIDFIDKDIESFTLPNNILGIEYLKALFALNSQIKPVLIQRKEVSHSDKEISNKSKYASSTSIRNVLSNISLSEDQKLEYIFSSVPQNTYDYLKNNTYNLNEKLWQPLKYEIIKLGVNGIKQIQEVNEGLENNIYKQALVSNSYEQFIFNVKSKRYTLSKIKRICVYILLGITKEKYTKLKDVAYARILKVKAKSSILLSKTSTSSKIPVITKITDDILKTLDENVYESILLDIFANNIFNKPNMDFTNKIIQP